VLVNPLPCDTLAGWPIPVVVVREYYGFWFMVFVPDLSFSYALISYVMGWLVWPVFFFILLSIIRRFRNKTI
jgi:hypothetical protein